MKDVWRAKLAKKPFKSIGGICSNCKMQLIHNDVCGPMQTESISGEIFCDFHRCPLQMLQGILHETEE